MFKKQLIEKLKGRKLASILSFFIFILTFFLWDLKELWDLKGVNFDFRQLIAVFLLFTPIEFLILNIRKSKNIILILLFFIALIFIHLLYNNFIHYNFEVGGVADEKLKYFFFNDKDFLSFGGIFIASFIFIIFRDSFYRGIHNSINFFLVLNFIFQFLEFIGLLSFGKTPSVFINFGLNARYSGLFEEPSHLALAYGPIFYVYCLEMVSDNQKNVKSYLFISLLLISSLLSLSATLIVSYTLAIVLIFFHILNKLSYKRICIYILGFFISFSLLLNINQLHDRFFDKENLSNKVIRLHTASAFNSLGESNLVGYGFNHYKRSFYDYIDSITLHGGPAPVLYNYNDGANNLNKLLGEFGLLGGFLILYVIYKIFKNIKKYDILFSFCSFSFLILTFIRSAGYFNAGYLISVLILIFSDIRSMKK
jgi:hypothetical protein